MHRGAACTGCRASAGIPDGPKQARAHLTCRRQLHAPHSMRSTFSDMPPPSDRPGRPEASPTCRNQLHAPREAGAAAHGCIVGAAAAAAAAWRGPAAAAGAALVGQVGRYQLWVGVHRQRVGGQQYDTQRLSWQQAGSRPAGGAMLAAAVVAQLWFARIPSCPCPSPRGGPQGAPRGSGRGGCSPGECTAAAPSTAQRAAPAGMGSPGATGGAAWSGVLQACTF